MAKPNLLNSIQLKRPKRSSFDLTHDVKLSGDMGNLIPVNIMECVPGDKMNMSNEALVRFMPLIAPVMHRMKVTFHSWFVPNRLVWPNWEKYITNQPGVVFPTIQLGNASNTKLCDYMGIPNMSAPEFWQVSALPFAAYQCIYNENYRDQNLIPEVPYTLQDGDNAGILTDLTALRKRAWMHDYFTAALPWAQKGVPVDIPLGDVRLKENWETHGFPNFKNSIDQLPVGDVSQTADGVNTNGQRVAYDPEGTLETGSTTINDLRRAFKLQEWLEKAARAGSRYKENILAFFGVNSGDDRLQRPEYIGGSVSPVVVSEVLNTTGEDGGLPQGNMAGHGLSVTSGAWSNYFCREHGYIITLMSIMPDPAYMQGIPKHFLKYNDPFEFFWPQFAHLGEQPVLDREIYAPGASGLTFGYVPRYTEYKFLPSRVAGDLRTSLKYWTFVREFENKPTLSQEFVECVPTKAPFAVQQPDQDSLIIHVLNKVRAVRPMPMYGTPSF